jgi:hypothetical protein
MITDCRAPLRCTRNDSHASLRCARNDTMNKDIILKAENISKQYRLGHAALRQVQDEGAK